MKMRVPVLTFPVSGLKKIGAQKNRLMLSWEETELMEWEWHTRRLSWMLAVRKDMAMICLWPEDVNNNNKDGCFFVPILFIQETIMMQWFPLLFVLTFGTITRFWMNKAPWMCILPCNIYCTLLGKLTLSHESGMCVCRHVFCLTVVHTLHWPPAAVLS